MWERPRRDFPVLLGSSSCKVWVYLLVGDHGATGTDVEDRTQTCARDSMHVVR